MLTVACGGPDVGGSLVLTYGAAADAKYAGAYEVTGISGSFFDTNNGLSLTTAAVGPLVPINYATPEPGSLWLLGVGGVGLLGTLTWRRRTVAAA